MNSYTHLVGAEQVQRAAEKIQTAATTMQNAAALIDESLTRHQYFLEDWLHRFELAAQQKEQQG